MKSIELSVFIIVSFLLCTISYTWNIDWSFFPNEIGGAESSTSKEFGGSILPFLIAAVVAYIAKVIYQRRRSK